MAQYPYTRLHTYARILIRVTDCPSCGYSEVHGEYIGGGPTVHDYTHSVARSYQLRATRASTSREPSEAVSPAPAQRQPAAGAVLSRRSPPPQLDAIALSHVTHPWIWVVDHLFKTCALFSVGRHVLAQLFDGSAAHTLVRILKHLDQLLAVGREVLAQRLDDCRPAAARAALLACSQR